MNLYGRLRFVRVMIFDVQDRVLVMRDISTGSWNFPGGKVGHQESFEDAAFREVREETGLRLEALSLFAEPRCVLGREKWNGKIFLAEVQRSVPTIQEPKKCDMMKFMSPTEVLFLPGMLEVLHQPILRFLDRTASNLVRCNHQEMHSGHLNAVL